MKKLFFKNEVKYLPLEEKPLPSLVQCLVLDAIGSAVILIPVLGELIWAPISAFLFWRMFGFRKGFFGGVFSFIEELIPGLDFIPTFTIMWVIQYARRKKSILSISPVR
ncbi:hypothetical protein [Flavisolibacter ginsengisoli]|jgi:hypothetical protein|uniref:Uncharacterized protein n=1 Tax=Flavisolibacter ginsengisoli DSM 18119 TaxID=1121884 RepID=A0A1M5CC66_9BACT|nr:hypothetical protein [Flavisolibacter ginsengisoli]SHF52290.1 hypothetical protein SAMN02745131_02866 [Flavisolibacter ginsengisoli DSM 18119]